MKPIEVTRNRRDNRLRRELARLLPGAEYKCDATRVGQPLPAITGRDAAELARQITKGKQAARGQS